MGKAISKPGASHESEQIALGELIHQHVRLAIETAVHEELRAALGAQSYERSEVRRGYRNGTKTRTLTGLRSAGKVVSAPVLGVVGVRSDGGKQLLALELCSGESAAAWRGCLDDLVGRGLRAPVLCIIDGNPGLRRAVGEVWPRVAVQRCCVHKLRNLGRKAPKHALAEIRDDFRRIVYAASAEAARAAYVAFERTWAKRCPGMVTSLREGGDELLTFFSFRKTQWKTLRSTNVIERLHGEFRRRVKTQGSLRRTGLAFQPRGERANQVA